MLSEQQQRIMGYFIEEAKDHLNTIEQGLVSLQATITDSEMVHEVFRAAHSVKGGAAMLGLDSIQQTAHRLEDYFKVLKECPQVHVDQKLETLFLRVYDTLHELVTQLQGPFGLTPDKAQAVMTQVEPVFVELSQHLSLLVNQSGGTPPDDVDLAAPATVVQPARSIQPTTEESALRFIFQTEVPARLRDMLQLFKQPDTIETRAQLQTLCRALAQFGEQFQLSNWSTLLEVAQRAIGHSDNHFRTLAPILIKDLKRSQEMILSGRVADVAVCKELLELLPLEEFALEEIEQDAVEDAIAIEADLAALLSAVGSQDSSIDRSAEWGDLELDIPDLDISEFDTSELEALDLDIPVAASSSDSDEIDDWLFGENLFEENHDVESQTKELGSLTSHEDLLLDDANIAGATDDSELVLNFELSPSSQSFNAANASDEDPLGSLDLGFVDRLDAEPPAAEMSERSGPEVGTAELDSLANLFENDIPNLDSTWPSEEAAQFLVEESSEAPNLEISEFHDLLNQDSDLTEDLVLDEEDDEDLSGLLNAVVLQTNHHSATPSSVPSSSDLASSDLASPQLQLALEEIANDLPLAFELPDSSSEDIAVFFVQTDAEIRDDVAEEAADCIETDGVEETPSTQSFDGLSADINISASMLDESLDEVLDEAEATDLVTELLKPIDDSTSLLSFEFGAVEEWEDDRSDHTNESELGNLFELEPEASEPSDLFDIETLKETSDAAIASLENSFHLENEENESLLAETEESLFDLNLSLTSLNSDEETSENGIDLNEIDLAEMLDEFSNSVSDSVNSIITNDLAIADTANHSFDQTSLAEENSSSDDSFNLKAFNVDELNADELNADDLDLGLELDGNLDSDLISTSNREEAVDAEVVIHEVNSTDLFRFDVSQLDEVGLFEDVAEGKKSLLSHSGFNGASLDKAKISAANAEAVDKEVSDNINASFNLESRPKDEQDFEAFLDELDDNFLGENLSDTVSIEPVASETPEDSLDLESMLEAEPLGDTGSSSLNSIVEKDVFSDLESMLETEPAPTENPALDADDFADLEALLEGESIAPASALISQASTTTANGSTALVADDREFDDLEALLQESDQKLGVGSSPVRHPSNAAVRRSTRRHVISDQTMRVSVKHLDNLNNLVGEMVVNRNSLEQTQERLRQFLDNLLYQVQQLNDVGQRMRDLYERSLLESSLLSSRRSYSLSQNSGSPVASSNHATGASFDALEMDRFTGFHTLSQEMIELIVRVRESASDIDFVVEESDQITRNFRQITTQLQEGLTRSRMVPFAQTADRLPRGVRDNAIKYGKQAELTIEGRDTLIDKMIVEQLYDPMTHLVNNAIAHGIETTAERIAAGKPPVGRITIRAFHQGNQTVISVSDDGAGINTEVVKAKAVAKGLISSIEAQQLSRLEIYDFLFHHGFSTADKVDDLRGRGVGLDVVRNNLSEIRGGISIDSAVGKGTTFTIRLPLTLSITKALCCISNRARIAFAMDGVEDMLDVPKDGIHIDEQGRSCVQWRDLLLPFQPLSDLLKYNRVLGRGSVYGGNQEEDILSIVVLRSSGNYLALQVDQVLGEQEIVIKQLEGPVPKPIGVAGATVLGDGRIMPIADVLELIDLSQGRIRREASNALWETGSDQGTQDATALKTDPTVLIVDDSITVRELLSMTFNKVGYRVEQARDGQEAWEKLRSGLPCDLVFCDIEMPRMDGLELLSRLQKDPVLCDIPIAMLTSRGADRHRQMAIQLGAKGYFTKPYLEEVLLDAAQRMLKGEILVGGTSN